MSNFNTSATMIRSSGIHFKFGSTGYGFQGRSAAYLMALFRVRYGGRDMTERYVERCCLLPNGPFVFQRYRITLRFST